MSYCMQYFILLPLLWGANVWNVCIHISSREENTEYCRGSRLTRNKPGHRGNSNRRVSGKHVEKEHTHRKKIGDGKKIFGKQLL